MATLYWLGNAHSTKQISTVTVANTWATGDTATLTINGKDLIVTIGSDTTTAQVAQAIRDAWNATSRLDSEGATDATSNFGGQEAGEFAEAEASIDPDATSVVRITARRAGYPFTLTVTETTAGSGTATGATAQAATGKYHWDNGDNWSGGSVPTNDDTVVFKDTEVSCLFGLPNGSLEVTLQVWMSFTGSIGLPAVNRWNQSSPYYEYRQRYVRLDDAGTGTNILHKFGIGKDGTGSPLINVKHSTLRCSVVVFNTGTPQISGSKALNICCTANTSSINILNGSVDYSSQDSGTSAFLNVVQAGGDSRGVSGIHTTSAELKVQGGTALVGGGALSSTLVTGGSLRFENQTGTLALLVIESGTVEFASTCTITALNISGNGTFDARGDAGGFTVTDGDVYAGGKFIDPYRRMTVGNLFNLHFEPSADLQFGASASTPIVIAT